MRHKNEKNLIQIDFICKRILEVYPFLTKRQRIIFEKKSRNTIDKFKKNKLTAEETVKELLSFLRNKHADIREWHRPDRDYMRRTKIKRMPTFELRNCILYIKIPSWLKWLGRIDKRLNEFCQKNINRYDAVIIDVRENQGGASEIAHNFAGIFFKKQVIFGRFFKKGKSGRLITNTGKLEPNKRIFIDKPVVILISRKCFSSNELFIAPFKISKRAILIGDSTAGGSANPISEIIKISEKKFVVRIPTWRFFLKGKRFPIEKTRILPDIFYKSKNIEQFAEKYLLKIIKKLNLI
jgi:C-terminal processing protease CtpA/Prc